MTMNSKQKVNQSGMVREIDPLGRVVLPKEMRRSTGMDVGTRVDISAADGSITITPYSAQCLFCGGDVDLKEFHSKNVCASCRAELKKLSQSEGSEE